MNDGFYGGLPGFSFIIVKSFASESEMIAAFKQGPNYTTVHYEEHVLINTENKNDPTNGNVYRRGYDYTDNMGGAIYVGTIVGPAGKAPMVEMMTIQEVKDKQAEEGYDYRYTEGSYSPFINLVPGKDGSTYNDSIEWACCSIRDENGEDTTAYIGFKFPYLVVEYTAESVSPYYNRSNSTDDFENEDLVVRTDDKKHPYYETWRLSVPKGIKGDTFKNFKVMVATSDVYAYDFDTHTKSDYSGKSDDIKNARKVLVYEYYHYDKEEGGEPVYIYLGDYNMVEDIVLEDDGTIIIKYTHDNDYTYSQVLKWIEEVTLTAEGHLTVTYNNTDSDGNNVTYETDLAWVKDVQLNENGKVTLNFTGGKVDEVLSQEIQWVDSVEMAEDGTITFTYNTLDESGNHKTEVFDKEIKYITSVSLAENGTFIVKFNNGSSDYVTTLKWVSDVQVESDGTVIIVYNTGTSTRYDKLIKVIKNVTIETADSTGVEGTGDQKVHVTYNTGASDIIGEPLNYIIETVINTENYHYLVYYSDPEKRQEIIDAGLSAFYNGKSGWLDLGAIKEENGILVGLNIADSSLSDIDAAISYLNSEYPNGLTGTNLKGKVVTIGETADNKNFYGFDYTMVNGAYKGWFYLGTFSIDTESLFLFAKESDSDLSTKKSALSVGGLWFIVAEDETNE